MKVGIITLFHNNINYGGVLQAYALSRVLTDSHIPNEQICYDVAADGAAFGNTGWRQKLVNLLHPKHALRYAKSLVGRALEKTVACRLNTRREVFAQFRQRDIPHSGQVYSAANVSRCCSCYDAFITGSDQVWNLDWYSPAYFLNFVPEGTAKVSYAASLGTHDWNGAQKQLVKDHLASFTAVSVREKDAVNLVQPLTDTPVQWVLDPTMLLSRSQWDDICAPRQIEKNYVFCYFLGPNAAGRKAAVQYAKKRGLTLITIPYPSSHFAKGDRIPGAKKLWDVSPAEFLCLIKYASCVFTDSFHACVFSSLYEREYFVFQRSSFQGMSSRLETLTSLYASQSHFCFCEERTKPAYIESLPPIDYSHPMPELEAARKGSLHFLRTALDKKESL